MSKKVSEASGTVTRVVRLLQCLAEVEDTSIKQLSDRLGLPASTVHRLLQLLMEHDLVERSPGGVGYRSGIEFFRMASLVAKKTTIADFAEPFLQAVVTMCNEACFFNLYQPSTRRVMIVRAVNSIHPLRYEMTLFKPDTLLWGASGRSVLAFLPQDVIDAALDEKTVSPATGKALPGRGRMAAELKQIREQGYACTRSQKVVGAVGIAAPVFGLQDAALGSLCVTVPEQRFDAAKESSLAKLVVKQAQQLSTAIRGDRSQATP